MKRWMGITLALAVGLGAAWLVVSTSRGSRGGDVLGKPIDPQAKAVKMGDILENSRAYRDKLVLVEGRIGAVGCGDCGGVIVTDKTWRLPVEPENPSEFRIPVKKGAPIKVWGVVRVGAGDADLGLVQLRARGAEVQ